MKSVTEHPHWDEFMVYHLAHPDTYRYFVSMARKAQAKGYKRTSIQFLLELGRWETGNDFSVGSGFRDYFRAIYARLIMVFEDDLSDIFEIRSFAHER